MNFREHKNSVYGIHTTPHSAFIDSQTQHTQWNKFNGPILVLTDVYLLLLTRKKQRYFLAYSIIVYTGSNQLMGFHNSSREQPEVDKIFVE